ncbi:MAG: aminodeoxychorismate/anthranilate synthase component II [Saprospiraceae bacterium]|nr:aminodeoxychorismate/anthranilate synthase component II [Saprospiraceae bacterium]
MRILLVDNYDSFTYNLAQILRTLDISFDVVRNDKVDMQTLKVYSGIIFSPGPGIPSEAGQMPDIIRACAGEIPMLGICLGHQAIAEHLGSALINREKVLHGVKTIARRTTEIDNLFKGLAQEFEVGRYHSWEVDPSSINDRYEVTALDEQGSIMAIEARDQGLYGMQFHPESIMTAEGPKMINNFINLCKKVA